jgi:hypothetical protein
MKLFVIEHGGSIEPYTNLATVESTILIDCFRQSIELIDLIGDDNIDEVIDEVIDESDINNNIINDLACQLAMGGDINGADEKYEYREKWYNSLKNNEPILVECEECTFAVASTKMEALATLLKVNLEEW